ncbi:hypothetical protein Hdeb2414_s0008g00267901 [Helianthus debilis subsp. tardiflorus]
MREQNHPCMPMSFLFFSKSHIFSLFFLLKKQEKTKGYLTFFIIEVVFNPALRTRRS